MNFAVAQESFQGPLGLLLELIEGRQLDITKVSLAAVADEYLAHLEKEKVPPSELADFLLVASRLIYLKSRELLPYLRLPDEEAGADELANQLRLYQEFAAAAKRLEGRYMQSVLYARPLRRPEPKPGMFIKPVGVTAGRLSEIYNNVLKRLEPFFALQQVSMERVKSVEERIEELTSALTARAQLKFSDMMRSADRKMDIVVSFLALLELLRRNTIRASQTAMFGDIVLERTE